MASNFKISVHKNGDKLNLVMQGDFDGTSACELLDVLKSNCNGVDRVFIDTNGLDRIYPFGQDTFENNHYVLKSKSFRIIFTGKNATQIAPDRSKLCQIL